MAPIPPASTDIATLIDAAHEAREDKPRSHLGASILGHPCDRWIWLSFRMAIRQKFPGRILRLFRRGHAEEASIISDLELIGIEFSKRQASVHFGAHVSGSADAIIESGMPEAPTKRHVAEFKTTNKKGFDQLEKGGVLKSKPEHWAQMQLYMHGLLIDRALYVAVCKDDDRLYTERVRYDKDAAEKLVARGKRIALSDNIPPPISNDPTWYQCRFCPAHDFCHKSKLAKEINCRTCAHSTAKEDSTWRCERFEADGIPFDHQIKGCDAHALHPDLVPWKWKGSGLNEWVMVYEIDGVNVSNGEPDATIFSSREIIANASGCTNETVREIKKAWPGSEVVG
tara:strand:+ start:1382 stop:2404 length:1023 start_codon:yes stop_codon:yes gene_type:complete